MTRWRRRQVSLARARFMTHGNVLGVWSPVPPHEYVSCGDVLTRDILQAPPLTACVCVREDLASTVSRSGACTDPTQVTFDGIFVEDALWASREVRESAALWSSDPDAPLEHLPRWGLFQFSKSDARAPGQCRPRLSVLDYVKSRQIRDKAEELNISLNVSVPRVSLVLLERGVFSSTPVRESDRYLVRHERNIGAHGRKHHDDSGGVVL